MNEDPRPLYTRLLQERRADIERRVDRHQRLGYVRLAIVVSGVAIVWAALASQKFSISWALIPILLFAVMLVFGEQLLRAIERRRRAARFFEKALARLDGKWAGT